MKQQFYTGISLRCSVGWAYSSHDSTAEQSNDSNQNSVQPSAKLFSIAIESLIYGERH